MTEEKLTSAESLAAAAAAASAAATAPLLGQAPQSRVRSVAVLRVYRKSVSRLCFICSKVWQAFWSWYSATTDASFIRSEINGRQSRHIVLAAFFCTDLLGAVLWVQWCNNDDSKKSECKVIFFSRAHAVALLLALEGICLAVVSWGIWSCFYDLPLMFVFAFRIVFLDAGMWKVEPATLVGDALLCSVLAVMCRVHSLGLVVLVVSQVSALYYVIGFHAGFSIESFQLVRFGHYSAAMLVIVSCAYVLDEFRRVRAFLQLSTLENEAASLAERLLFWKASRSPPLSELESWQDDLDMLERGSCCSSAMCPSQSSPQASLSGSIGGGGGGGKRPDRTISDSSKLRPSFGASHTVRFVLPQGGLADLTDKNRRSRAPTTRPVSSFGRPGPMSAITTVGAGGGRSRGRCGVGRSGRRQGTQQTAGCDAAASTESTMTLGLLDALE